MTNRHTVDRIADLDQQIAALKATRDALAGSLKEMTTDGVIEGDENVAIISTADRRTTNWKKIAIDLGASEQRIRSNTRVSPVTTLRIKARVAEVA